MQERAVPTVARALYLVCIFLRCSIKPSVSTLAFIIMNYYDSCVAIDEPGRLHLKSLSVSRNAGRARGVVESAEGRLREMEQRERRAYFASSEYREWAMQALQQQQATSAKASKKSSKSKGGAKGKKSMVTSMWLARGRLKPTTTKAPSSPAQPADPRVVDASSKSLKLIGSLG